MKIWLTQRAEPTPHDQIVQRRPMRTGLMAEYLSGHGEDILWWTGDYDHYGRHQRGHDNAEMIASTNFKIRYISAVGYGKTKSIARVQYDRDVAKGFVNQSASEMKPDIIIASMPSVDLALASVRYGLKHGTPVIVDVRDLHPTAFIEAASYLLRPFVRLATMPMKTKVEELCHNATAIWGNSDTFVEWGCRMGGRRRGELDLTLPIAYKPLLVDRKLTSDIQSAWRRNGLFLSEHLNIVFFGTLSKSFNFGPVFEAARVLNKKGTRHRFHFFGAGQQQPFVSEHCAKLENCIFHGAVGAAELQAAMSLSDVGIAPYIFSGNFAFNMPNKTTEYLGGGLILALAFKTGALADFLRTTKSGFCYETSGDLVNALTDLEDNATKLTATKHAAKAAFEQHLGYETLSRRMHDQIVSTVGSSAK